MQISISIRHGRVSEPTQAMIRERLEKLPRLYDRITSVLATLDLEHRDKPVVDLKVLAKRHEFVSVGQGENLIAAADAAVERIEQQLRKHKKKVQDRHRVAGHKAEINPGENE